MTELSTEKRLEGLKKRIGKIAKEVNELEKDVLLLDWSMFLTLKERKRDAERKSNEASATSTARKS